MEQAKILEFSPDQMTLYDIMLAAQNADDGNVDLSEDDQAKLGELFRTKVDAYQYYFDSEDALIAEKQGKIDVLQAMIDRHQEAIDRANARKEAAQKVLLFNMNNFGFKKVSGNDWTYSIRETKALEITDKFYKNPDESIFEAFPQFVRKKESKVTYEWQKNELKKAIESGEFKVNFAKIQVNQHLKCDSKGR
jgi:hypothetical protein